MAILATGQDTLTNDAVLKMLKAGLSESIVISMVQSQPGRYALTTDDLVQLKQHGVSDKILAAMITKASGAPPTSAGTSDIPGTTPGAHLPQAPDIGPYFHKGATCE